MAARPRCRAARCADGYSRPKKGMSDYLSTTPADGILAAHCRPQRKFGISVEKAASDKIRHRGGGRTKNDVGQDAAIA